MNAITKADTVCNWTNRPVAKTGGEMNAITKADTLQPITDDLQQQFIGYLDRKPSTIRTYKNAIAQFAAWTQAHGITHPGRDDIRAFRDDLQAQGKTANTIRNYLHALKAFFAWTAEAGIYPDITQRVTLPKTDTSRPKRDALTRAEVLAIEGAINTTAATRAQQAQTEAKDTTGRTQRAEEQGARLKALYLTAVVLGLRCIELSRANIEDLTQRNGQYFLNVQGKGRDEADQKKALPAEVAQAILDYLDTRGNPTHGPLFAPTGNRNQNGHIASTTISTMLKQAMKAAGIDDPHITAHSLRHTAATAAMKATGGDIYTVQKYLRHASPATTEVYLHMDDDTQDAQTANKVYAYLHPAPLV